MRQVNVHQAKTQLSQLMAAAESGEEVIIARAGKPAIRLVPVGSDPGTGARSPWPGRKFGSHKAEGEFDMDWWAAHKEEVAANSLGMTLEEYRAEGERFRREDLETAEE